MNIRLLQQRFSTESASEPQHLAKHFLVNGVWPVQSVLIVDDNALIRQAVCELFAREVDFDVCAEAVDGKDAIEKAQLFRPDLIVTDLSMPVMNGLEEARALRELMPTVPVIVFTAFISSALEKEAAASGVSAIISKSERAAVLIATARTLLDEKAS